MNIEKAMQIFSIYQAQMLVLNKSGKPIGTKNITVSRDVMCYWGKTMGELIICAQSDKQYIIEGA